MKKPIYSIFIRFIKNYYKKETVKLQMRKNKIRSIDSYDKKTSMRIQFISKIYVYRQK